MTKPSTIRAVTNPTPDRTSSAQEVAIVGIGCRLPGGIATPQQLVKFLRVHGDAIVDVPADRWNIDLYYDPDPAAPGKTYVKRGGFLQDDVFSFDPEPFGISPREADQLDPQQRLLLEVSWEALEDAGIAVESLRGSATGVFVGGFTLDYQTLAYSRLNQRLVSAHTSVGASMTLLSNRISYTFDLRGPSLTVDTACSSSLVATHLAYQALVHGQCDLALVGGVTVMLSPATTIAMSKGHFLSPDGRCKTFDAHADGYGRGEGAGIVVLKRLEHALRDGDRIYATVRATGIGQDGRTDGIPMPSDVAQRDLGARVLADSGFSATDVQYVEAHGTGTRAGDQAETRALGALYAPNRQTPLLVGSIKSNIGHLEAAAGVAGLIKAALSVHLREIFPLRELKTPNPEIPFERLMLQPALHSRAWPTQARAVAVVNSFGYGGTNANAIVCEPPAQARAAAGRDRAETSVRPHLIPVSGATPGALRARAAQLASCIDEAHFADQVYTLARRRPHMPERAVLFAASARELRLGLSEVAQGQSSERHVGGRASSERKLLWVFTGMGPQWWAMGHELFNREPEFRRGVQAADAAFERAAGWSILQQMQKPEAQSQMRSNAIAQPANFVLQVGLTALLRDLGVPAHGMLGHSVGELAAAWAAGCLSLEQAALAACERSRLQQTVAGRGTMLATALSTQEAQRLLAGQADVSIAAFNAPKSVTLAGTRAALEAIGAELTRRGVFNRIMPVEIAYHSAQMDPLDDEFHTALRAISPSAPQLPLYSTAFGARVETAIHDADYFWHNARDPVLLERALTAACSDGYSAFLEIGPHPVLAPSIREVLDHVGREGKTFFCLKRKEQEQQRMLKLTAELFANGVALDWAAHYPQGRLSELPKYPFQRERHFVETATAQRARLGPESTSGLFSAIERGPCPRFFSDLTRPAMRYLGDHRIRGAVVFPAAAYVDAALGASRELDPAREQHELEDLRFDCALIVNKARCPLLALDVEPSDGTFRVSVRHDDDWEHHGTGRMLSDVRYAAVPVLDLHRLRSELGPTLDIDDAYTRLATLGLEYGFEFRRLETLQASRAGTRGCVLVQLNNHNLASGSASVHPTLLDAAIHGTLAAIGDVTRAMVPISIEQVRLFAPGQSVAFAYAMWTQEREQLLADVKLATEDGTVVLELRGLTCRALEQTADDVTRVPSSLWHADTWRAQPWPEPVQSRGQIWLLAGTAFAYLRVLAEALAAIGIETRHAAEADAREPYSKAIVAFEPDAADPVGIEACASLQRLLRQLLETRCCLRVITFGGQQLGDADEPSPDQAALVGLARAIMTEHPVLCTRLVDVGRHPRPASAELLALLDADAEDEENAVRGAERYVRRVRRDALSHQGPAPVTDVDVDVELVPRRIKPAAHELEVELLASALDRGEEAAAALRPGARARMRSMVGRVVRHGASVTERASGEIVQFVAHDRLRSHMLVDCKGVLRVPEAYDPFQAVRIAELALGVHIVQDVAGAGAGDCVLVHDAGSRLGLACVQLARAAGARVLATAATAQERGALLALGVEQAFCFDTSDFVDEIRHVGSVDVVINTLPEPTRSKSLSLLESGGRFVDVVHRVYGPERLVLRHVRSIRYCLLEREDVLLDARRYQRLAQRALALLELGRVRLETARTPAPDSGPARPADPARDVVDLRAAACPQLVRADRSYLVTGGLSGFGLATAEWLVDQGACHVVLASRRGEPDAQARPAIDRMRAAGADVLCAQLDVSELPSIEALLGRIERELPPLAGVFHSAVVLEDRPLLDLDPSSLQRVLRPKALGALLLYRATAHLQLDHFVLYSSVSAWVGNPNQSAYAAANTCLDAIAALARREGRAATSISWGALGDVGVVARDIATQVHLQQLGIRAIPANVALAALEQLLRAGPSHAGVIDVHWDRWMKSFPRTQWQRLCELLDSDEANEAANSVERMRSQLGELDDAARRARVLDSVRDAVSSVLHVKAERIDDAASLRGYGIDSLMALELQSALEATLGVSIPSIELLAGVSLDDLTRRALLAIEQPTHSNAPTAQLRAGTDLRQELLARICVQPPYFALSDLVRDGEWVQARAHPLAPGAHEGGLFASAEAARHLAIVGSCAVSLQSPIAGKVYYPVWRAHYAERPAPAPAGPVAPLTSVRVRGRCTHFDVRNSRASAETELLTEQGEVLLRLQLEYHVVPEHQFKAIFQAHAMPTDEASGADPYAIWPLLTRYEVQPDHVFRLELGPVDPRQCLGHFVGYPALPLSVMMRRAVQLVATGVRRALGLADARIQLVGGSAQTSSFIFAHEQATLTAAALSAADPMHGQRWRCTVEGPQGEAAVFEFQIELEARSAVGATPRLASADLAG